VVRNQAYYRYVTILLIYKIKIHWMKGGPFLLEGGLDWSNDL